MRRPWNVCQMSTMQLEKQQWTIASLASGSAAMVILLLALATKHWVLSTENCTEEINIPSMNTTLFFNYTAFFNYGLWQFCMTETISYAVHCLEFQLDISDNGGNREKTLKSISVSMATRIALPPIVTAVVLAVLGFLFSILGNFKRDKRIIVAAVMYISSGFCLSFSVILFISRINDELSLQPNQLCSDFSYRYGWSFYLIGIAFVLEESSAVISIKLFLMQNSKKLDDMVRIIPGLENKLSKRLKYNRAVISPSQTMIW